jgi:O-antigen chain-terminating methyltransferase
LSESLQQIAAQILEIMQSATEQQRANELAFAQQAILEEHLGEARRSFDESTSNLSSQLALVIDKIAALTEEPASVTQELALVRQELTAVRQDLAATQNAFSQDRLKTGEAADQLQTLRLARERIETELLMQERRLTVLLEALARNMPAIHDRDVAAVVATEEQHLLDPLYAAFEDEFRGPRDEILQRLQVYVPFLHNAEIRSDVLDLGCGRGEWLELLKSESIDARGVDRNRVFIEACRRADLNVIQDDALVYLRSLAGESLNLVTAFHLVEHLPFEMLIKLLDEIARTLRHGGMLILETPNPENFMVGSCTFYADPTHRNPIPTKTLQFLVESRGFKTIEVLKLRSWIEAQIKDESELAKRFNEYFYSAPDYAVIAGKP